MAHPGSEAAISSSAGIDGSSGAGNRADLALSRQCIRNWLLYIRQLALLLLHTGMVSRASAKQVSRASAEQGGLLQSAGFRGIEVYRLSGF